MKLTLVAITLSTFLFAQEQFKEKIATKCVFLNDSLEETTDEMIITTHYIIDELKAFSDDDSKFYRSRKNNNGSYSTIELFGVGAVELFEKHDLKAGRIENGIMETTNGTPIPAGFHHNLKDDTSIVLSGDINLEKKTNFDTYSKPTFSWFTAESELAHNKTNHESNQGIAHIHIYKKGKYAFSYPMTCTFIPNESEINEQKWAAKDVSIPNLEYGQKKSPAGSVNQDESLKELNNSNGNGTSSGSSNTLKN